MNAFFTLWRKELTGYFLSPVAYVVSIFFLVVMGAIFSLLVSVLADGPTGVTIMNLLFGSTFFWIAMLIVMPLLTMRLLAEEKRNGTLETLLTAPVSDPAVVLAKYAGALSFYVLMWLPTVTYLLILRQFSALTAPVDFGPMAGGYLGALLVGMLYLAIGLFCSALTSNQIVAAFTTFGLLFGLFLVGLLDRITGNPALQALGEAVSSYQHMLDFSRGLVDSRPVVFYVSATALFLYATIKVLEARSWK